MAGQSLAATATPVIKGFSNWSTSTGKAVPVTDHDTAYWQGVTFSKPGGKPTMAVDANGQIITPYDIVASAGPWIDIRSKGFAGGAKCDDVTNDAAAIQAAFDNSPADSTIIIPGACRSSGNIISKRLHLVGMGSGRWWSTAGRLKPYLASQEYLLKIGNVANSIVVGGSADNLVLDGDGKTFTDAMFVGESWSSWHFKNCGFHNAVGRATRLRVWFEGRFEDSFYRNNDATGKEAMFYIDQIYNADNSLNVNNLTIQGGHFERNKGNIFASHASANLDVFRVMGGSKFEQGMGPVTGGPWSVFKMGAQANRVSITGNHFTNFKAAYNFDRIFQQAGGSLLVSNNEISATDASTYLWDISGATSASIKNNTLMVFDGTLPLVSNTSTRSQDLEYPKYSQNITYPLATPSAFIYNRAIPNGMLSTLTRWS
jgi:hypothetical protein